MHLGDVQAFLICQHRLGELYLTIIADFLKSLPKLHSLTSFWRCSRVPFLLARQAVSDVLMQVSSQTCSCTEKDRPERRGGKCGINPESAALPLPPFLSAPTARWEAHRHSTLRHSQAFLASLPRLRRDEFVLPSTPLCEAQHTSSSSSSHKHI